MKTGVLDSQIKKKVFGIPEPFVTTKIVYNSFSSVQRPTPQQTEKCLMDLQQEKLGGCPKTGRELVFYKEFPSLVSEEEELAKYKVSLESYAQMFEKNGDLFAKYQVEKITENHPNPKKLNEKGHSLPVNLISTS